MNSRTLTRSSRSSHSPSPDGLDLHGRRRRRSHLWRWVALVVGLPVLAGGLGLWWFVLRHDAPAAVDLDQAVAGIEATAPGARTGNGSGTAAASSTGSSATDGTWTIDRSITNAEGTGSFAGFRIDEVLVSVGSATAVGRSPSVEGTMTVSGATVTAAQVSVDLTDVTTNDSRRDGAVQRALATSRYPNATFVLTQPIQAGSVPAEGERITLPATGDLTIHGVTRTLTIDLQVQRQGDVLVVVGSAPVALADYGVTAPTAPVVASVEDHGTFEFQLYFKKS